MIVDQVTKLKAGERLGIRTAAETFIWGISNRQTGTVWHFVPATEQMRFGNERVAHAFFARIHPQIANAKSIFFDRISREGDRPVANIYITDKTGNLWLGSFGVAMNQFGAWKIISCRVVPAPGNLV